MRLEHIDAKVTARGSMLDIGKHFRFSFTTSRNSLTELVVLAFSGVLSVPTYGSITLTNCKHILDSSKEHSNSP